MNLSIASIERNQFVSDVAMFNYNTNNINNNKNNSNNTNYKTYRHLLRIPKPAVFAVTQNIPPSSLVAVNNSNNSNNNNPHNNNNNNSVTTNNNNMNTINSTIAINDELLYAYSIGNTNSTINSQSSSSTTTSIITSTTISNIANIIHSNVNGSSSSSSSISSNDETDILRDSIKNDDSEVLRTFEDISNIITFYYVPILVCTGSIGNILSVVVFFRTKLSKLSSSYYLSALAISDTCFLSGLFVQWLNYIDINIYNRNYCCQFFTFFSSLASFCSVWFVVAFTVERFIAVMYPLRRQTMCTVRRAKIVLSILIAIGFVHCAPFLIVSTPVYSARVESTICDIQKEYKEYITLLNYWDTVVVYVVPFTAIVVLNTFTGCTVWKFATVRRTLTMQKRKSQLSRDSLCAITTASPSTYRMSSLKRQKSTPTTTTTTTLTTRHLRQSSPPTNENEIIGQSTSGLVRLDCDIKRKSGKRRNANSSQLKVTKMLLIVSTVFVCLNLPSCILRMITYLETQSSANEKTTVVLQYIFQLLFMTNFGINFVLYCVSGQNFRKAVLSMFRGVSAAHREGTTQITVSEYCRNSGLTGASTRRRRMMSTHCWNEMHEMHPLK